MKKLKTTDFKVSDVTSRRKAMRSILGVTIAGLGMSLSSCISDSKTCSDSDRPADGNGSTRYDVGPFQDSFDFGGDTDRGYSDANGNGSRCADFD